MAATAYCFMVGFASHICCGILVMSAMRFIPNTLLPPVDLILFLSPSVDFYLIVLQKG
jgi:hypothetical protein